MPAPLWTSADIEAVTGGLADAAFACSGLSIDTRSLMPGDLFVALKDVRDGHDFVPAAFDAGAAGAVVSRPAGGRAELRVDDVLDALTALAVAARARSDATRTAITGSVGKTSVKEMLARIYRAAGPAHWPEKSFNNHWGVPLTLARMPQETQRAVFEIGMSTPGEIAPRSKLVRPHHAMITKIAPAHLEGVGSIEGVADEKSDIFAGLEAGGTILLPADDVFRERMEQRAREYCPTATVETFGTSEGAIARVTGYQSDGQTSVIDVSVVGRTARVAINAVGEHWAVNVASALLMATRTGISLADASGALTGYTPPPGRGVAEALHLPGGGTALLVDDSYNANPESMRAALAGLAARKGNRRIVALGEMLEIGANSEAEHAGLAGAVEAARADAAFLAGEGMRALDAALPGTIQKRWSVKALDLSTELKNHLQNGDIVLIKGSNASGMHLLADALRQWSVAAEQRVMGREDTRVAGVDNDL
ncbi:MAG: UDP-N-acetylmuramoyl-tripeptide--D-alanyl-D-alanine ligase [Pseudomonadota bacterium]